MALSDYEKQVLADMEAQLKQADPSLSSIMSDSLPDAPPAATPPGRLSPRRIALGSMVSIVGLVIIVGGVTLGFGPWGVILGVLGFVLMVVGIMWALRVDAPKPSQPKNDGNPKKNDKARFMDRQQDRWDRRRQ